MNLNYAPFADIPADSILELFGKTFFEFCQDSGYDKILQVLGATPRDFLQVSWLSQFYSLLLLLLSSITGENANSDAFNLLSSLLSQGDLKHEEWHYKSPSISLSEQNLDALHDHLATLYPGMRAPSFRCTETDGSLILHYYSDRPGLEHIVIGIVKVSRNGRGFEFSLDSQSMPMFISCIDLTTPSRVASRGEVSY